MMRRAPAARSSGFRKLASTAAALLTTIKLDVEKRKYKTEVANSNS